MPDIRYAARPFEEQVNFFKRKVNVPSAHWLGIRKSDHAHGFIVAGVDRMELLNDLFETIKRAQEGSVSLEEFQREFPKTIKRFDWRLDEKYRDEIRAGDVSRKVPLTDAEVEARVARRLRNRARIIYDTNIRQAYNAGRYQQLTHPDMLQARPYWQYRHNDKGISKTPRPAHQAWDRKTLRYDDPWWDTHFPSNGWNCKCGVRALTPQEASKLDPSLLKAPTESYVDIKRTVMDSQTGEITERVIDTVPYGVDRGFDFSIGEASQSLPAMQAFGRRILQIAQRHPEFAEFALDDASRRRIEFFADWSSRFVALEDAVKAGRSLGRDVMSDPYAVSPFGLISNETLANLSAGHSKSGVSFTAVEVNDLVLSISRAKLLHGLRETHYKTEFEKQHFLKAVAGLKTLPEWVNQPATPVYYQSNGEILSYLHKIQDDVFLEVRVVLDSPPFGKKKQRNAPVANWSPSSYIVTAEDIKKRTGSYHIGGEPAF